MLTAVHWQVSRMAHQLLEHVGIDIPHRPDTQREVAPFKREALRAVKELLMARVLTVCAVASLFAE
jgi:endonuclease YncB( thermonuclease family)